MKWKHRRAEERRRTAMERQQVYDLRIDQGFSKCQTTDSRQRFVDGLKPMQRKRVSEKFAALLEAPSQSNKVTISSKKEQSKPVERHANGCPKLDLTDTLLEACVKFSDGNPGAATVLGRISAIIKYVDPFANELGLALPLMQMETAGIFGERLWMLYKDVCSENSMSVIGLLRAVQLNIITATTLNNSINNPRLTLDIDGILKEVCIRLPGYNLHPELVMR